MITATGNNFGGPAIQIKDYQDDNLVVLNTSFTINPSSAAYQAASVLEIYVPELSISKSANTGCIMCSHELMWPGTSYSKDFKIATAVKTWIKDSHTICIEKLGVYDDLDSITFYIHALYPTIGKRGVVTKYAKTRLQYTTVQTSLSISGAFTVVEEGWCMIHFYVDNANAVNDGVPIVANLGNVPTDISADFAFIGGNHQADHPGTLYTEANIANGVFTVPSPSSRLASTGYTPFVLLFLVRG